MDHTRPLVCTVPESGVLMSAADTELVGSSDSVLSPAGHPRSPPTMRAATAPTLMAKTNTRVTAAAYARSLANNERCLHRSIMPGKPPGTVPSSYPRFHPKREIGHRGHCNL